MKKITIDLSKIMVEFRNPKDHDVGAIMESIRRFGFVAPLIVNSATGKLLAGHGRTEALRLLWNEGEAPPENIVQTKDGEWKIPAVEVTIEDEAEALAYLVADNRLTELGGWDESELIDVMKDLSQVSDELLGVTGFDMADLEAAARTLAGEHAEEKERAEGRTCPHCGKRI